MFPLRAVSKIILCVLLLSTALIYSHTNHLNDSSNTSDHEDNTGYFHKSNIFLPMQCQSEFLVTNGDFSEWIYNDWSGNSWNINSDRAYYSRWNGSGSKIFEQTIAVTAGEVNTIEFDVGANTSNPNESTLNVKVDGVTLFSQFAAAISSSNGGNAQTGNETLNMATRSIMFTPTTSTVTLTFEGISASNNHDLLFVDNVYQIIPCVDTDTDGDSIPDYIDLDDDNDGIPDADELSTVISTAQNDCSGETILDFSASAILISGAPLNVGAEYRIPNITSGTDALVTIMSTVNASVNNLDNNSSEASAFRPQTSFNIPNIGDRAYIEYNIRFVNSGGVSPVFIDTFFMNFNDIDGNNNYAEQSWSDNPTSYIISSPTDLTMTVEDPWVVGTSGTNEYGGAGNGNPEVNFGINYNSRSEVTIRVGAEARVAGANAGGRQHNIEFSCLTNYDSPLTYSIDSDFDGKANHIDNDSDNDGIYDVVEAGHGHPHTSGFINGSYGSNGLADIVETTTESGLLNYAITNTDTTDAPNYLDTDSDNDLCSDANEAYANANADGGDHAFYGVGNPPNIDTNGAVSAAPYTVPANINSNGVQDYLEDSAPVITGQPENQFVEVGGNAIFSVTATGDNLSYQWQVSTNAGITFSDISGETASVLNIFGVSNSEDGNLYRVLISAPNYACQATISEAITLIIVTDFDNDGVIDAIDLDSDNDGIPNGSEASCTNFASFGWMLNNPAGTLDVDFIQIPEITDWMISSFASITSNGITSANPASDLRLTGITEASFADALLAGHYVETSFTTGIDIIDAHISDIRIGWYEPSQGDSYSLTELISDDNFATYTILAQDKFVTDDGSMQVFTDLMDVSRYNLKENTTYTIRTYVYGHIDDSPQNYSVWDDHAITLKACQAIDSDSDGIADHLDLDSDNDGIYDVFEAGHSQSQTNGMVNGLVGTDGIPNSVQNFPNDNFINYSIADSDGDGNIDAISLDSDNDGCTDVLEAGFTDDDNDGLLGSNPLSTDGLGLVTSGSDGYTEPADGDSNTTFDFQEFSNAPSISLQPADTTLCPGCSGFLSVTSSNSDTYQWQYYNGSIWVDLVNSGIYSGVTTNELMLTQVTPVESGNQYRVVISSSTYVCSTITSNVAILTVNVPTVITNKRITYRIKKN